MTSLLKCPTIGLSREAVSEVALMATREMASEEAARRDPEVAAIAKRRQFSGSEKRRLLAEGDYRAIARSDGRTYERNFKVITGVDGEVEVLAR